MLSDIIKKKKMAIEKLLGTYDCDFLVIAVDHLGL